MKIVRKNELVTYSPKGHYGMLARRAYGKAETGNEILSIGYSTFLPEGGAEMSKVRDGMELVYYVVYGELTITTPETSFVLQAGDSVCFMAGDERSVLNKGDSPAAMLVIAGQKT